MVMCLADITMLIYKFHNVRVDRILKLEVKALSPSSTSVTNCVNPYKKEPLHFLQHQNEVAG